MSTWLHSSEDDAEVLHRGKLLKPSFYLGFLSRRWFFIAVPFLVISLAGLAIAVMLPPTYVSEGRLIVQPQQISTELVRPTVTSAAQDRIQLIEQRAMSHDKLLEIARKYQLFPEKSDDDSVELLKKSIKIAVIDPMPDFGQNDRSRGTNPPIVFSVGFEYGDPIAAEHVASELIQRILNEDVRDRVERASNTTRFMSEEVQKLQAENTMLDAKVTDLRASLRLAGASPSEFLRYRWPIFAAPQ